MAARLHHPRPRRRLAAELVTEQMAGLTVNPKVVDLDTRQPEFVKSTGDYVQRSR